jgi:hypothetical protein
MSKNQAMAVSCETTWKHIVQKFPTAALSERRFGCKGTMLKSGQYDGDK